MTEKSIREFITTTADRHKKVVTLHLTTGTTYTSGHFIVYTGEGTVTDVRDGCVRAVIALEHIIFAVIGDP